MSINYDLGKEGEVIALNHYLKDGFKLIVKNYQFYKNGMRGRLGEIDLIMEKNNHIHLIEVKTRSGLNFGFPVEQINKSKLRHLYKTYQYFIIKNKKYKDYFCIFDVVSVVNGQVSVVKNAYSFDDMGH